MQGFDLQNTLSKRPSLDASPRLKLVLFLEWFSGFITERIGRMCERPSVELRIGRQSILCPDRLQPIKEVMGGNRAAEGYL